MPSQHLTLSRLVLLALCLTLSSPTLGQQPTQLGIDNLERLGEPEGRPLSGTELDRHTEELTDRMRCPVCQGLSIADSGTMIAQAMKAEVKQFLAAGYTDDQIMTFFEASYGEFIRLEPRAEGFNLVVWIAPALVLIVGTALVAHRLRRRVAPAATTAPQDEDIDLESYRERVRQEISS